MKANRVKRLHKRRRNRDRRGTALIMVLLAVVMMTVFLTEIQQESATSFSGAIAARERVKAEYHARSAVNLARLLIATEPAIRRAVAPMFLLLNPKGKPPQIPVWEFTDQVLGVFNDAQGAESFGALAGSSSEDGENVGLGVDGRFDIVIVDEDSKLNVNTAARGDIISQTRISAQLLGLMGGQQYNALFEQQDTDGQHSDRTAVCGAIVDWADPDENLFPCNPSANAPAATGVEDNFYQTIGLSYLRKNAAFDSLDELRLVRGLGSEDMWSTFVDPDPDNPKKRVMTVWGQGAINVNTANAQTILAVVCANAADAELCLDPIMASNFIASVSLVRSFTAGAPLFSSTKDFVNAMKGKGMIGPLLEAQGITPVVFKSEAEMRKQVATSSKVFSIYATGIIPSFKRETRVTIHSVVDFRNANEIGKTQGLEDLAALAAGSSGSTKSGKSSEDDELPEEGSPEALLAALSSNPIGNMIYWRIE